MRSLKVATLLQVYETLTRDEQMDIERTIKFMREGVHYENSKLLGGEAIWLEKIIRKPNCLLPYRHFMVALAQWKEYLASVQSARMRYGRSPFTQSIIASTTPGIVQCLIGTSADGTENWETNKSFQYMMHMWSHILSGGTYIEIDGVDIVKKLRAVVWG
jgi:hypothetical protein